MVVSVFNDTESGTAETSEGKFDSHSLGNCYRLSFRNLNFSNYCDKKY